MVMDDNVETVKLHGSASTCECFSVMFAGDISLIPARITFSMIGKFGISGTFAVVALYTPEIFPTTLRSQPIPHSIIHSFIHIRLMSHYDRMHSIQ